MTERECLAAINAGMAFTGVTRRELAKKMGIHYDTLNRKLRMEKPFTLAEILIADNEVRWTEHMRRK